MRRSTRPRLQSQSPRAASTPCRHPGASRPFELAADEGVDVGAGAAPGGRDLEPLLAAHRGVECRYEQRRLALGEHGVGCASVAVGLTQDGEAVPPLPDGPRAGIHGFRERRAAALAVEIRSRKSGLKTLVGFFELRMDLTPCMVSGCSVGTGVLWVGMILPSAAGQV